MAISWIQPSFAGGEIGPSLYGRIDMAKYQVALRKCDNFIVRQYGGVENRPGTRFVGAAKYPNRKCRLIPFQFSTVQTYALEFGTPVHARYQRWCVGAETAAMLFMKLPRHILKPICSELNSRKAPTCLRWFTRHTRRKSCAAMRMTTGNWLMW